MIKLILKGASRCYYNTKKKIIFSSSLDKYRSELLMLYMQSPREFNISNQFPSFTTIAKEKL